MIISYPKNTIGIVCCWWHWRCYNENWQEIMDRNFSMYIYVWPHITCLDFIYPWDVRVLDTKVNFVWMILILKILGRFTQRLKFLYIFLRESQIAPSRKIPFRGLANSNSPGTDLSQTQMSIYGQNVPNVHKWSCRGCLCHFMGTSRDQYQSGMSCNLSRFLTKNLQK